MRWRLLLCGGIASGYVFKEEFDNDAWTERWQFGSHGGFEFVPADGTSEMRGVRPKRKHGMYSSMVTRMPFTYSNREKDLAVSFSFNFNNGTGPLSEDCASAYVKLHKTETPTSDVSVMLPYVLQFGVEVCPGKSFEALMMFKHGDKVTRRKKTVPLPIVTMLCPHLHTIVIGPKNNYSIYYDMSKQASGEITRDFKFDKEIEEPNKVDDIGVLSAEVWSGSFPTKYSQLIISNILVTDDFADARRRWLDLQPRFDKTSRAFKKRKKEAEEREAEKKAKEAKAMADAQEQLKEEVLRKARERQQGGGDEGDDDDEEGGDMDEDGEDGPDMDEEGMYEDDELGEESDETLEYDESLLDL